jgi:hypothetical protein
LTLVPVELRARPEEVERALRFAEGRDPAQETLASVAPFAALLR